MEVIQPSNIKEIIYNYDIYNLIQNDKINIIIDFGIEKVNYEQYKGNKVILLKKDSDLEILISLYNDEDIKTYSYDFIKSIKSYLYSKRQRLYRDKDYVNKYNKINTNINYFVFTFFVLFNEELDELYNYNINLSDILIEDKCSNITNHFINKCNDIKKRGPMSYIISPEYIELIGDDF